MNISSFWLGTCGEEKIYLLLWWSLQSVLHLQEARNAALNRFRREFAGLGEVVLWDPTD